ncbi:DUF998 domain-containing protein [Cellulomonas sp. NPDC055163]
MTRTSATAPPPPTRPLAARPAPGARRATAVLWIAAPVLFLVCHLVVERAWSPPYSWARNMVSDLGNVGCGPWGDDQRLVCSPLHTLMNAAMIGTGVALVAGVVLTWRLWPSGRARAGRVLVAAGGLGWVVAGAVPADVDENVHVVFGAFPVLVLTNLGLLLVGLSRAAGPGRTRVLAAVAGTTGLAGSALFLAHVDLGLGLGGMERVAALPVLVWMVTTGFAALHTERHRPDARR